MLLCLNSSLCLGNALKRVYREGVPVGGGLYKSGVETKLGNEMYQNNTPKASIEQKFKSDRSRFKSLAIPHTHSCVVLGKFLQLSEPLIFLSVKEG